MNVKQIAAIALSLAAATSWVAAQPATGKGAPVARQTANGIDYMSGGAGQEDRDAMAAQQGGYTLKVVMSGRGGEYVVTENLRLASAKGDVLSVANAGPIVMVKLPAGSYTLETTWHGKTERRSVNIGGGSLQTVNWSFAG
ncbi:MAG: hypothetical protein JSR59_08500 [Proteobacteria bacterium]|nr:hypothetical protein [Pseudomonadota bacterium]